MPFSKSVSILILASFPDSDNMADNRPVDDSDDDEDDEVAKVKKKVSI